MWDKGLLWILGELLAASTIVLLPVVMIYLGYLLGV